METGGGQGEASMSPTRAQTSSSATFLLSQLSFFVTCQLFHSFNPFYSALAHLYPHTSPPRPVLSLLASSSSFPLSMPFTPTRPSRKGSVTGFRSQSSRPCTPSDTRRGGVTEDIFTVPQIGRLARPRNGSLASKVLGALSLTRRETPRPAISAPIANVDSPIRYEGPTVDLKRPHTSMAEDPNDSGHDLRRSHSRLLGLWTNEDTNRAPRILDADDWPNSPTSVAHSLDISLTPPPSPLRNTVRARHNSMSAAHTLSINFFPSRQNSADSVLSVPTLPPLSPAANEGASITPSAANSLSSAASNHFRIKRKPVPRFDEPDGLASCTTLPERIGGAKTLTRAERHKSLDTRDLPDRTSRTEFQIELGRLFDQLYDECRAGASTDAVRRPPVDNLHRRSRSDYPEACSSSTLRLQPRRLSRILCESDLDNRSFPATEPRARLAETNPFFGGGRDFGASRSTVNLLAASDGTPKPSSHVPRASGNEGRYEVGRRDRPKLTVDYTFQQLRVDPSLRVSQRESPLCGGGYSLESETSHWNVHLVYLNGHVPWLKRTG
ncbi:hypothetical protein CC85DRAFT_162072 [Cutaneotrichosporon oleaginosum]|uniref:Uncharacterized protein n=1 Tax=Cutaneotrichosporon oleaginosum TaxID=879819 RepID=A0A0J1AXV7_9TREE|nr:uncharacterized protein CC85DRAFT_162072 [Cutaneotrichosporon oleaginosum]KLT40164.1 hypothetical protein CC85DRAFT_162072 [Cutaneotrichosporon oleaginosum]TXT06871.1 hypothetical protein COLE_06202 [Cutaneotrichosporon oleaginosum]